MNKPLILSLKSTHSQNTLITSFMPFLCVVVSFYYLTFPPPFIEKPLIIIIMSLLILYFSNDKYIDATCLILNKEYLLSPNGFPFLSYYKTVRINWADVQKTTLTAAPFAFSVKQNKEDSLKNIKLTFYTTQGKFILYPEEWKVEEWKISEIPPKMNKKERILQLFKEIRADLSESRTKLKEEWEEERKKGNFFTADIRPPEPDSYTSAELDAYLYTLPLMQFLTKQNIKIQQDKDLLRTKYLSWEMRAGITISFLFIMVFIMIFIFPFI